MWIMQAVHWITKKMDYFLSGWFFLYNKNAIRNVFPFHLRIWIRLDWKFHLINCFERSKNHRFWVKILFVALVCTTHDPSLVMQCEKEKKIETREKYNHVTTANLEMDRCRCLLVLGIWLKPMEPVNYYIISMRKLWVERKGKTKTEK